MPKAVNPRRPYNSPRRAEQAGATRRAVVAAARTLFLERGYVPATIEDIAGRAGVSPETVYAAFKNKRSLLQEVIDVSIAGDDARVPVLDRAWVLEMRREPDRRRRLRILARNGRIILERIAPVYEILRGAAAADEKVAGLLERYKTQRLAGQKALMKIAAGEEGVRPGLTLDAASDVLFAIGSPEAYTLLVTDRGWSPARFERWYADALERLLLR